MQIHLERRTGTDRRHIERFSAIPHGQDPHWFEASGDEPYDPIDPYWEPVKGQDDD